MAVELATARTMTALARGLWPGFAGRVLRMALHRQVIGLVSIAEALRIVIGMNLIKYNYINELT